MCPICPKWATGSYEKTLQYEKSPGGGGPRRRRRAAAEAAGRGGGGRGCIASGVIPWRDGGWRVRRGGLGTGASECHTASAEGVAVLALPSSGS